jgi:hypothetical protein
MEQGLESPQWFDWTDNESVSTAVIEAVARVSDEHATDLAPLYESVDPDALDTLFSEPIDDSQGVRSVEFRYESHQVAVEASGDGWIR